MKHLISFKINATLTEGPTSEKFKGNYRLIVENDNIAYSITDFMKDHGDMKLNSIISLAEKQYGTLIE